MVVFGGIAKDGTYLDDTWQLQWRFDPLGGGLVFAQCSPSAIFNDGSDSARCEVRWDHRLTVTSATLGLPSGAAVIGETGSDVALYDDGTHGDRVAHDEIWSRDGISYTGPEWPSLHPANISFNLTGNGPWGTYSTSTNLGVVSPASVAATPATDDPAVLLSRYVVFISDPANVYCADYHVGAMGDLYAGMRRSYAKATNYLDPDRSEFAAVAIARQVFDPSGAGATPSGGSQVRLAAANIGFGDVPFDYSWLACCGSPGPGSCGRCNALLGQCYLNHRAGSALVHEIGHTWGIFFGQSGAVPVAVSSHWRAGIGGPWAPTYRTDMQSIMSPQMLDFRLVGDSPCVFVGAAALTFDEYDQYLLGLIPSSALPDVLVLDNPIPPAIWDGLATGTCSGVRRIVPADLVAAEGGERVPDWTAAPHSFDLSIVAVSPEFFSAAELVYFERLARWMESGEGPVFGAGSGSATPFYEASSRLATVNCAL